MKAQEFVQKLKASAPSVSDYIKRGYSEKLAKAVVKSFYAVERKKNTTYQDEVLKLVDCYDASDLIIGQVKFYNKIEEKPNYYIVGEVEADWLIVDKITGVIRVVELYSGESLWPCAANGSKFLEAILMANMFFGEAALNDDLFNSQKATCAISEECCEVAGGEQFLEFYKMLLGCFE